MHKVRQSEGVLGRLLSPLPKNGLPLMKKVLKFLAKSVLIPLGLIVVAAATDVAIHKKTFRSGNQEMNDIMVIVKSLEL